MNIYSKDYNIYSSYHETRLPSKFKDGSFAQYAWNMLCDDIKRLESYEL